MARLTIQRGATYSEDLKLEMDITGATVYFTAKSDFDADTTDESAVIKKDLTTHSNPTEGITKLTLASADTDITPGEYICDIHVKKSDNTVVAFKPEILTIGESVTLRS